MFPQILAFSLWLSFQLITLPSSTAQSFAGKWKGTSEGEVGMMSFDKKGCIAFIIDGKEVGGKKFSSEGVDLTMHYEYNEKVEPHTLDFVISYADGSMELTRMLGIYKFVNDKTLIINMDFHGRSRPEEFDDDDKNQVTLTKIK
jgi:23S rRNA maturation-related 3'-5' exoribonuclease YhaM